jgi:hypothetical protein
LVQYFACFQFAENGKYKHATCEVVRTDTGTWIGSIEKNWMLKMENALTVVARVLNVPMSLLELATFSNVSTPVDFFFPFLLSLYIKNICSGASNFV